MEGEWTKQDGEWVFVASDSPGIEEGAADVARLAAAIERRRPPSERAIDATEDEILCRMAAALARWQELDDHDEREQAKAVVLHLGRRLLDANDGHRRRTWKDVPAPRSKATTTPATTSTR